MLRGANFGKLYAHAARETAPAPEHLKAETRGSWTMFHQSDDPRTARRLAGSLRGHGTGWCTAGESTAAMQLQGGDFYVYYTRDEDGKDTVPRVAIRMEEGTVAEVRGINAQQELEPAMTDITLECLKDLDGGETYIQKAEDMKRLTSLEKRLHDDPSTELSKDDIIFLYELDHDIQGFGYERDPRIDETKELRGARDYVVLKELAVERIRDSFPTSYQAYQNIAEQLGLQGRYLQKEAIKGIFEAKLKQWQETGVIDYVAERIISHGEVHTPVMTPNVLATGSQIKAIAQLFGEGQPYETYIDNSLYNQYSPEELCRPPGYDPMRIGLMPTSYDKELTATVETQLKILRDKQLKNPELKLRVPSVLEALVYWQILRERGYKLDDDSAYEKTFIRHFNLEPATDADFWRRVPNSRVYNTGKPHLDGSDDIRTAPSRLLIG